MVEAWKTIGHSRVSSKKQDAEKYSYYFDLYEKRTGNKIDEIVMENKSATKISIKERVLWKLIDDKEIKTIVIPNVSRCVRSVPDAVDLVRFLKNERTDLTIVIEDRRLELNDNMSNEDENYFYDLANTSSRENSQRAEVVKLALKKTKARGVKLGRPNKYGLDEHRNKIMAFLKKGMTKAFIARALKVNQATLYRWLAKEEKEILEEFGYSRKEYKWDFKTGELIRK